MKMLHTCFFFATGLVSFLLFIILVVVTPSPFTVVILFMFIPRHVKFPFYLFHPSIPNRTKISAESCRKEKKICIQLQVSLSFSLYLLFTFIHCLFKYTDIIDVLHIVFFRFVPASLPLKEKKVSESINASFFLPFLFSFENAERARPPLTSQGNLLLFSQIENMTGSVPLKKVGG